MLPERLSLAVRAANLHSSCLIASGGKCVYEPFSSCLQCSSKFFHGVVVGSLSVLQRLASSSQRRKARQRGLGSIGGTEMNKSKEKPSRTTRSAWSLELRCERRAAIPAVKVERPSSVPNCRSRGLSTGDDQDSSMQPKGIYPD
jgi:hypothetical protein